MLALFQEAAERVSEASVRLVGATTEQDAAAGVGHEGRHGWRGVRPVDESTRLALDATGGVSQRGGAARALPPAVQDAHAGYRTAA
jgi:hypothetical protein